VSTTKLGSSPTIQYISDLHLEFSDNREFFRLNKPKPSADILCIAGDLGYLNKHRRNHIYDRYCDKFIDYVSENWKYVIIIPGNHEFYGGYPISNIFHKRNLKLKDNVHFLISGEVYLEDPSWDCIVHVLGGTLWSHINPLEYKSVFNRMNDYNYIYYKCYGSEGVKLTPGISTDLHETTVENFKLFCKLAYGKEKQGNIKRIILTHHAPHFKCLNDKYISSDVNSAYYTNLEKFIDEFKPNLWVYGHTHDFKDFNIYDTRIVQNSIGYHPSVESLPKDWDTKTIQL
jgi:Icc-related predicted phosphoesterase